jgi:hypothetical protein
VGVTLPLAGGHVALIGQERRTLREKHGKGPQGRIDQGIGFILTSNRKINPSEIYGICGVWLQPILAPMLQDNCEACGENDTALEAGIAFSEIERTRDQTLVV